MLYDVTRIKQNARWVIILLFVPLLSCVDEIDLQQGAALPDGIVIQGSIISGEEGNKVNVVLERLFRFENSNRPDRIVSAQVILENSEGQQKELDHIDGSYTASLPIGDETFRVEPGLGYRIQVTTREGEMYETEYDIMPEPLAIQSVSASLGEMLEPFALNESPRPAIMYSITANTKYPDGSPTHIRWILEQVWKVTDTPIIAPYRDNDPKGCYITRPFQSQDLFLFSSLNSSAQQIQDLFLAGQIIDYHYAEGHYMNVYQQMLSSGAWEYFDQIDQIASRDASLFEPPGGPVSGNAYDVNGNITNVYGYFYAASQMSARVGVSADDAMNPDKYCPLVRSPSPFPRPNNCDECLFITGSTLERPSYWQF